MARRAQSGLKPLHITILVVLIGIALSVVWWLMNRGGDPMTGVTPLDPSEYLESAASLSGNVYRVEGTIDDRLENWKADEGRLFSVQVSEGSNFLPVWVPPDLETNIQRGQRYLFKVRVLDTGVLQVLQLIKT